MNRLHNSSSSKISATASLDRLFEMADVLSGMMQRGVAERGLTPARTAVLWALIHHRPMTQRALARTLNVTPRNVTGLVDALQSEGYVARDPHPTDRRATIVSPTDRGRATVAELRRGRDEMAVQLFGDVPAAQLETFLDIMGEVLRRLHAPDLAASRST